MTHGSLFSGIGGFDISAEWAGWENKFHCENNEFCNKVLNYYWPNAKSYGDIKEADFSIWRGLIDVLSGGFPCQPYSQAGKRKGNQDDRHLWPFMLAAIKSIQPRWVVGENVHGLINWSKGLVFHEVQADLEVAGYEVWPYVLPACSLNAPHRRDRIWFVAHCNGNGLNRSNGQHEANTNQRGKYAQHDIEPNVLTNTRLQRQAFSEIETTGIEQCDKGDDANASNKGLQGSQDNGDITQTRAIRNELFTGLLPPGWQEFPTQPPLCSRNDGLPSKLAGITISKHRTESIKAYGNAVVPQLVYEIFKTINQYEQQLKND